jgi:hypothetical protein
VQQVAHPQQHLIVVERLGQEVMRAAGQRLLLGRQAGVGVSTSTGR